MPSTQAVPAVNRLLHGLPPEDYLRFMTSCEPVTHVLAETLTSPGDPMLYVHFPIDSVISLEMPLDTGAGLQVKLIGNEGMLGGTLMLGVDDAPFHALVRHAGSALRMAAPLFLHELQQNLALQQRLNRYLQVSINQLAQTAVCVHFHVLEARLARLLLMTRDRAGSDVFHLTHELLAQMLGVRRVGVTKAACSLQKRHFISYRRGDVTIHDVVSLQAISCGCYRVDKATYDRILDD